MDRRTIPGCLLAAHATTLLGHPLAPRTHDTTRIASTPHHATAHLVVTEAHAAPVALMTDMIANRRHAPDLSIPMMSGMIPSGRLSHGALAPRAMAGTTRPHMVSAAMPPPPAGHDAMTAAPGRKAAAHAAGTTISGKTMAPGAHRTVHRAMDVAHVVVSHRKTTTRGILD